MGFYNFCYSLVFFLLCFGYWMRWRDGFGPKQLVTLCVLGSLLYFSHAVGFFMAAFFIGVVALLFGLAEWHYRAENGDTRSGHTISVLLKRVLVPQLAFLPCLVLFFVSSIGSQPETNPVTRTFSQRLMVFRELYVLVDTRGALGILRVCLVGSFLLWGFYLAIVNAVKQLVACDGLGILAATCLSLYIVLPWSISGGGMIPERMAWFGLCGALLWMGSKEWTIKARQAVIGVSTLVVVLG
jgi:predicted small integral membrane protein